MPRSTRGLRRNGFARSEIAEAPGAAPDPPDLTELLFSTQPQLAADGRPPALDVPNASATDHRTSRGLPPAASRGCSQSATQDSAAPGPPCPTQGAEALRQLGKTGRFRHFPKTMPMLKILVRPPQKRHSPGGLSN